MQRYGEYLPGEPAHTTGRYLELNVFGTPTGRVAYVAKGDALPAAPLGFVWRHAPDSRLTVP